MQQQRHELASLVRNVLGDESLSAVHFSGLSPGIDMKHLYVWGVVTHTWKFHRNDPKRPNSKDIQKLMLAEVVDNVVIKDKPLIVLLIGQPATSLHPLSVGNVLVISNAIVEEVRPYPKDHPEAASVHSVQLIADDAEPASPAKTWVIRDVDETLKQADVSDPPEREASAKGSNCESDSVIHRTNAPVVVHRDYTYMELSDVQEDVKKTKDGKYNVYAVVRECQLHIDEYRKKSMKLSLRDPTLDAMDVTVLQGNCETFPDVWSGSIIRLHRMKASTFRSSLKGVVFNARDVAVFDGSLEGSLEPASVGATVTMTEEDKERVKELREWLHRNQAEEGDCTFESLVPGGYGNVACQVLDVQYEEGASSVLLIVWDGTKPDCVTFGCSEAVPRHPEADKDLYQLVKDWHVHVTVYESHVDAAKALRPGSLIRMCNLHVSKPRGATRFLVCLHSGHDHGRRIVLLDPRDPSAQQLNKRLSKVLHEKESSSKESSYPLQDTMGMTDTMEVLMFESDVAPSISAPEGRHAENTSGQKKDTNTNSADSHLATENGKQPVEDDIISGKHSSVEEISDQSAVDSDCIFPVPKYQDVMDEDQIVPEEDEQISEGENIVSSSELLEVLSLERVTSPSPHQNASTSSKRSHDCLDEAEEEERQKCFKYFLIQELDDSDESSTSSSNPVKRIKHSSEETFEPLQISEDESEQ